jgi:translation initiation factor 2B subunit (eIF-2B alpha/beta/delta family)
MNKELLTAVLTALNRASREMSLKILEDEKTREGIARILLEEIEKKGVMKELTIMDALKLMMEEIRKTREELKEEHRDMAEGIGKAIGRVIDGQTRIMETMVDVVRQEGQFTREKIDEAKKEVNEKMSDHFYYANRLRP